MAYLQESDYTLRISIDHLEEILTQAANTSGLTNNQVRANAENWGIAMITQYLAPKWQIGVEFTKTAPDASRNFIIIGYLIDLAVYTIHRSVNPRDIPENVDKLYQDAMSAMPKIRSGELPLYGVSPVSNSVSQSFVSSGAKFVSQEFKEARGYDDVNDSPIPGANSVNNLPGYYNP